VRVLPCQFTVIASSQAKICCFKIYGAFQIRFQWKCFLAVPRITSTPRPSFVHDRVPKQHHSARAAPMGTFNQTTGTTTMELPSCLSLPSNEGGSLFVDAPDRTGPDRTGPLEASGVLQWPYIRPSSTQKATGINLWGSTSTAAAFVSLELGTSGDSMKFRPPLPLAS
jgi:hypothetical protein